MHRVVVILGSNIDKERNLPAAIRLLADSVAIIDVSTVYETAPVGLREQPHFFNAAVLLQTHESAAELKDGLLAGVERRLGRRRTNDKNAPRTIDLDIALYDSAVLDYIPADGRVRHIPEPDLLRFAHCALPVADLLPDMPHPETGESIGSIAARMQNETLTILGQVIQPRFDINLHSLIEGRSPTY